MKVNFYIRLMTDLTVASFEDFLMRHKDIVHSSFGGTFADLKYILDEIAMEKMKEIRQNDPNYFS